MEQPESKPRKYRFRYSLRMLLLATTLAGAWLGWTLSRVNQRDFILGAILERGGAVEEAFLDGPPRPLPMLWKFFGARPVATIRLPRQLFDEKDLQYTIGFFPEAAVWRSRDRPTMRNPVGTPSLAQDVQTLQRDFDAHRN